MTNAHLVKKFLDFKEKFASLLCSSGSKMDPTMRQFKPFSHSHSFAYKLISIMSAWVLFSVRNVPFLSGCSAKMLYTVPLCSIRTICGVHLALFEVMVFPHYTITKRSELQPKNCTLSNSTYYIPRQPSH